MWTPKRVLLLVFGFTVFITAYFVYAHFLGAIDGLPDLPQVYWPTKAGPTPPPSNGRPPPPVNTKLRQAFGEACPELEWAYRIELKSKRYVLAARDFKILEDGTLKFYPLSIAVFGKEALPGKVAEINTVRGKEAVLTFDKPIANITEIGSRHVIRGELKGNVEIVNNRRTEQRDDDVSVF